jgi:hypothetical protein
VQGFALAQLTKTIALGARRKGRAPAGRPDEGLTLMRYVGRGRWGVIGAVLPLEAPLIPLRPWRGKSLPLSLLLVRERWGEYWAIGAVSLTLTFLSSLLPPEMRLSRQQPLQFCKRPIGS